MATILTHEILTLYQNNIGFFSAQPIETGNGQGIDTCAAEFELIKIYFSLFSCYFRDALIECLVEQCWALILNYKPAALNDELY